MPHRRSRRALPLILALTFTLAPTSAAATPATVRAVPEGSGQRILYTGTDAAEALVYARTDFQDFFFQSFLRGDSPLIPTSINTVGTYCRNLGGPGRVQCFRETTRALSAEGQGGNDWLQLGHPVSMPLFPVPSRLDGGDGDDFLEAGSNRDTLIGGSGDDILSDFPGDDVNDAGPGDDAIYPGDGNDTVDGGPGVDRVDYHAWGHGFDMTPARVIDNVTRATDTLRNVENLFGSNQPDTIAGDDDANHLVGLRGADAITGHGGQDRIDAGLEDDRVSALDGTVDFVDCGPGTDHVSGDTIDVLSGCENKALSDELVLDADLDGSEKPGDCDDRNRARRPGTYDVPENGVDEDCDGVDAQIMDRDRDHYNRPQDCDDANPQINPGATDIPGNRLDEDCRGGPAPYPVLDSTVGFAARYYPAYTRFTDLFIRRAHAGTVVRVTCRGRSCPFRVKTRRVTRDAGKLVLSRLLRGARLRPRARLQVRITRPATVGIVTRLTTRAGTGPKRQELCLPPGATRASRCSAATSSSWPTAHTTPVRSLEPRSAR